MLVLVGCNHRSAPIAVRERLSFPDHVLPDALRRLAADEAVAEALILSTCNRVEILVRTDRSSAEGMRVVESFLAAEHGVTADDLRRHGYHRTDLDAVRHLFQVAAGLDSMILGEPQILGQVRQAFYAAREAGTAGRVLERLMQQCLATAKRVRSETGISRHAVSVAFAAVELARQIFGDLTGRSALLLGAGKMSDLVARHLRGRGVTEPIVASRSFDTALEAAERCAGRAVHWDEGLRALHDVDVVVSATGASRFVVDREMVAAAARARRGQPLLIVDIAVPRDVDPRANEIDNVYLYDIDGLNGIVEANLEERKAEAEAARRLIAEDAEGFARWRQALEVTPTIVALRERMFELGFGELERFRARLGPLSAEQQRSLEQLVRAVLQKVLHRPVTRLRHSVERRDVERVTELYREIFDLAPRGESAPERDPATRPGPRHVIEGGRSEEPGS